MTRVVEDMDEVDRPLLGSLLSWHGPPGLQEVFIYAEGRKGKKEAIQVGVHLPLKRKRSIFLHPEWDLAVSSLVLKERFAKSRAEETQT
jgi:hypothetical protein